MKRLLFLLMIFGVCYGQENIKNIAVLDLDPTGVDEEQARFLTDRLRAELFKTGTFNVVERDKMNSILQEQGFQQSGCTSVECAVEIGQLLNVREMVAGTLGKIENLYSINLRLIDVEKGTILKTATRDFSGSLSDVLTRVIPDVAKKLAQPEHLAENETAPAEEETNYKYYAWSVQLRYGTANLNYKNDFNDAVKEYNDNHLLIEFDDIPASTVGEIEIYYKISANWRIHSGLNIIRQSAPWKFKMDDFSLGSMQFEKLEIERNFEFTEVFLGLDYIKSLSDKFDLVFGAGLGIYGLKTTLDNRYRLIGGDNQDSNQTKNYTNTALNIRIGFDYRLADKFSIFLYLDPLFAKKFKTEDKQETTLLPDFSAIVYPENIDGSGTLVSLGIGYLF
ncbi:MAG: hypothetical protein H6627_13300 [Calditrichae bacterium]|nr:hypothetical protein [Calditrichia bacterium]